MQPQTQDKNLTARVLVIDDEPLVRQVLERALRRAGYQVMSAGDGREARELFAEHEFDVVLTDLHMPSMDGIGVLKMIRDRDPDLPVILFTAEPTAQSAIEALQLRATAYLCKPFEPPTVLAEVERALTLQELARVRREAHDVVRQRQEEESQRSEAGARFERALEGLFMVYQPIVCWSERSVFGYEALVRTAEESVPHPGVLFDLAEQLGRVRELGCRIREKCVDPMPSADARASLFVNLHSADLAEETLYSPQAPLTQIARRVVLEITERAHLGAVPEAQRQIQRLRGLGFRIAIDDIGAGYSGLNSFAMLRPDLVKLDMALVRNIHEDPMRQHLVRMVIDLCRDLGISVVGEGIECAAERDLLASLGCDLFQGYLFAKPALPFIEPSFE